MASREVIVLVCDLCGKDTENDGVLVDTHLVHVDGMTVEAEVCARCWAKAIKSLMPLAEAGRPAPKRVPNVSRRTVEWPGSMWQFSSHALVRIGERYLNPVDVLHVAEYPDTTYPGIKPNLEVRVGSGGIKVVVNPEKAVIVTASARDEEVEQVS